MGYPKALLPLGNVIFITHILKIIQNVGLPRPIIILGRAAPLIQSRIQGWPADVKINPDPDRGQISSIQIALSHAGSEYEAGLIWPVDQPAVSAALVSDLVQLFLTSGSRIAFPRCGNKRGHPAIFHRCLFPEFMGEPLEEGPKNILLRYQQETVELPTEETATIQDIDTPAEYQALTGESLEAALARTSAGKIV
jgi:molybdenum cofactor cytidylyltransferase